MELTRQSMRARSAERINEALADTAQRMSVFPGFRLVLVRPKKRFERAKITVSDLFGARYVVVDEQRCWSLHDQHETPTEGSMVLGERGVLFLLTALSANITGPGILAVTDEQLLVDVEREFEAPALFDEDDDPDQPMLRHLRETLAKSFVEHERGTR
ncbi:hypothetical protein ACWDUL_33670 [Nocardia niigatensis]